MADLAFQLGRDQRHFSPLTNLSFALVLPFNRRNKKIIFECGCRNLLFLYVSLSLSFLIFSLKRRDIWGWQILSLVWRNLRLDSCLRFSRIPLRFSQLKYRILSCETSALEKTNLSGMKKTSFFLWFLQSFPTNFGKLRKFPSEYPWFRIEMWYTCYMLQLKLSYTSHKHSIRWLHYVIFLQRKRQ